MKSDCISVIIPVYNVQEYIESCVISVLNQTHNNIQVILIDDGSTDRSGIICDELSLKDDRIVVIHQTNQGSSAARNTGLKYVKGDYIAFVDSDDLISPTALEVMLKEMKNGRNVVVVGLEFVPETYKVQRTSSATTWEQMTSEQLLNKMIRNELPVSVVNKMYLTDIIMGNNVAFNTKGRFWEDLLFNASYFKHIEGPVGITNQTHYYARERVGSQTRTQKGAFDRELIESTKQIKELFSSDDWTHEIQKSARSLYAHTLVRVFFSGRAIEKADVRPICNELRELRDVAGTLSGKRRFQYWYTAICPYLSYYTIKVKNKIR